MTAPKLTDKEFDVFKKYIHKSSGIQMKAEKKVLIESRLAKRLRNFNHKSYGEYFEYMLKDLTEQQVFIDIITTNETSFFREPHHYDYLKQTILPKCTSNLRIWSAACSIGAEAYSAAMVCDDTLSGKKMSYEIVCTDINADVVQTAQLGLYPNKFLLQIPKNYLQKYCLKGTGEFEGQFVITDKLKEKFYYKRMNLLDETISDVGMFDIVFLRNMLIYFDTPEKKKIVENVVSRIKRGGYLFIGHSESLFNISNAVTQIKPTVYQKL